MLFQVIVHSYSSKNNCSVTITDATGANLFFKATGGQYTKRGSTKNSQKVILQLFGDVQSKLQELAKVRPGLSVILKARNANFQRADKQTYNTVLKAMSTLKLDTPVDVEAAGINYHVVKTTRVARSKIRLKSPRRV